MPPFSGHHGELVASPFVLRALDFTCPPFSSRDHRFEPVSGVSTHSRPASPHALPEQLGAAGHRMTTRPDALISAHNYCPPATRDAPNTRPGAGLTGVEDNLTLIAALTRPRHGPRRHCLRRADCVAMEFCNIMLFDHRIDKWLSAMI